MSHFLAEQVKSGQVISGQVMSRQVKSRPNYFLPTFLWTHIFFVKNCKKKKIWPKIFFALQNFCTNKKNLRSKNYWTLFIKTTFNPKCLGTKIFWTHLLNKTIFRTYFPPQNDFVTREHLFLPKTFWTLIFCAQNFQDTWG